jgi:NAD(P)-dependent dehydrogenase (short-subunit alcohol dehydrogenase family)
MCLNGKAIIVTGSTAGIGEAMARRFVAEGACYADQALEALGQAVAGGWENVPWMDKDRDLDALRDRAEFRKLVQRLRERAQTEAEEP